MARPPLTLVALVALGGAVGSLARFAITEALDGAGAVPSGTLAVNLLGALLIGLVTASVASESWRTAIGTGVLGGFTTYSALAVQTRELLVSDPRLALGYALATLAGGWLLALVGLALGRRWQR